MITKSLIEQLVFMEKVSKGIADSDEGRTISNEEMKNIIDGWSS